jgi:hypothetical protein
MGFTVVPEMTGACFGMLVVEMVVKIRRSAGS